jgi:CheY-like chemotaxis protein
MNKPFIITVDDDPNVLKVIDIDLRNRYGELYRVFALNSGNAALDYLADLKEKSEHVALFLVDQRMPQMTGVEFLGQARVVFPTAKRVLLTAYADTEASISVVGCDVPTRTKEFWQSWLDLIVNHTYRCAAEYQGEKNYKKTLLTIWGGSYEVNSIRQRWQRGKL